MKRAAIFLGLALAGCTVSGTGVQLTVEGSVDPDTLEVTARYGGRSVMRQVGLLGAKLPTTIVAELPDETLSVIFDVRARRAGQLLGEASSPAVQVQPREIARVTVVIGGGAVDGGGGGDMPDGGSVPWSVRRGGVRPLAPNAVKAIWGASATDLYAVCELGGGFNLLRSIDGKTWTTHLALAGTGNLNGVWGSGATDVHLVGANGVLLSGSGTTFTSLTNPGGSPTMHAVWGLGMGDAYAVGANATIVHLVGTQWLLKAPSVPISTVLYDVWGASGNDIWVVGSGGTILHAKNGGSWMVETSNVGEDLHGVWGTSANDIWTVGSNGVVLHSTGNGMWTRETMGVPQVELSHVWGFGASDIYAVGSAWTILKRSGGAWMAETSPITVENAVTDRWHRVWGTGVNDVFVVGAGQTILHKP
jgi:hypothetical protein